MISFQDNWPKLEKWFNKFDILTKLDADSTTEDVHSQLKQILNDTVTKLAHTAEEERRSEEALVQAAVEKEAEANKGIGITKVNLHHSPYRITINNSMVCKTWELIYTIGRKTCFAPEK